MADFYRENRSNKHFEVTVLETEFPDVFWVALKPDEETDSFAEFEKELNDYMKGREIGYRPVNNIGDYVLAFNEKRHIWVRGEVVCILEGVNGTYLEIFQLDYGSKILVLRSRIHLLDNKKFQKRPFNAIKLHLPGLQPIGPGFSLGPEDLQADLRCYDHWVESAQKFIENCLNNCTGSRINVLKQVSPNMIDGELFLTIDGREFSVSEELIHEKFAVRSDVLSSEETPESSIMPEKCVSTPVISSRDYRSQKTQRSSVSPENISPHPYGMSSLMQEASIEVRNRQFQCSESLINSRQLTSGESIKPNDKLQEKSYSVGKASRTMLNRSNTSDDSVNMSSETGFTSNDFSSFDAVVPQADNLHSQNHSTPILSRKETWNEQPFDKRARPCGRGHRLLSHLKQIVKSDASLHSDISNKTKSTYYSNRNPGSSSSSSRENQLPLGLDEDSSNECLNSGQLRNSSFADHYSSSLPLVPKGRAALLLSVLKSNKSTSRGRGIVSHDSFDMKVDNSCDRVKRDCRMDKEIRNNFLSEKASISKQEETTRKNICQKRNCCNSTSRFSETYEKPNKNIDLLSDTHSQDKRPCSVFELNSEYPQIHQQDDSEAIYNSYQEFSNVKETSERKPLSSKPSSEKTHFAGDVIRKTMDKSCWIQCTEKIKSSKSSCPISRGLQSQREQPVPSTENNFSDTKKHSQNYSKPPYSASRLQRNISRAHEQFDIVPKPSTKEFVLTADENKLKEVNFEPQETLELHHSQARSRRYFDMKCSLHSAQDSGYNCSCSSEECDKLETTCYNLSRNLTKERQSQNRNAKNEEDKQLGRLLNSPSEFSPHSNRNYGSVENRTTSSKTYSSHSDYSDKFSVFPASSENKIKDSRYDINTLKVDTAKTKQSSFVTKENKKSSPEVKLGSGKHYNTEDSSKLDLERFVNKSVIYQKNPEVQMKNAVSTNNSGKCKSNFSFVSVERKNSNNCDLLVPGNKVKELPQCKKTSIEKEKYSVRQTQYSADGSFEKNIEGICSEMQTSPIKKNTGINNEDCGDFKKDMDDAEIKKIQSKDQEARSNFSFRISSPMLPLKVPPSKVHHYHLLVEPHLSFEKSREILISGDFVPNPVEDFTSNNFTDALVQELKSKDFAGPVEIQSYVWPAVSHGRHVVVIGPPRCGKTLSYLIPVLSLIMSSPSTSENGCGPLALILCPSSNTAERLYFCLSELATFLQVHCLQDVGNDKKNRKQLLLINGCSVLIATPSCFLQTLKLYGKTVIELGRLQHFILEEMDVIAEDFKDQLLEILKEYKEVVVERKRVISQIIACAEHWTEGLYSFMRKCMNEPLLYISNFSEAAVFTKIKFVAHICQSSKKDSKVIELLYKLSAASCKTVICTAKKETAKSVHKLLMHNTIPALLISSDMTAFDMRGVTEEWNLRHSSGDRPVLIIVDDCFIDVKLTNADTVIHYDIPRISKAQFNRRLVCILDEMQVIANSVAENNPERIPVSDKVSVQLFVTEENASQASSLVKLLSRYQCKIPDNLRSLADGFSETTEELRSPLSYSLCYNLRAFGKCSNKLNCSSRHTVSDILDEPLLPVESEVKILILHTFDAAYYSARLLTYTTPDGTVHESNKYGKITFGLLSYFKKAENKVKHNPEAGTICAHEQDESTYIRVQIMPDEMQKNKKNEIAVHFLDFGWMKFVKANSLLKLPDVFLDIPPQAVEIHLCNVKPKNLEKDWPSLANAEIERLINNKELIGKVRLCLGRILWLAPLKKCVWMETLKAYNEECELTAKLLSDDFADENSEHLTNLYEICPEKFIPRPDSQKSAAAVSKMPVFFEKDGRYAFLETQVFVKIIVSIIINPSRFYVQQCSFSKCLDELSAIINESDKLMPLTEFQVGMLCLARFSEDNKLYRAKITEIENESVKVFFLDYGDTEKIIKEEVFFIEKSHLTRLPFQAIQCSLAGVIPNDEGKWSIEAEDFFIDFVRDADDVPIEIFLWVPDDNISQIPGTRNYKVLLYNFSITDDPQIDEALVKRNLALKEEVTGRTPPNANDFEDISDNEVNALARPILAADTTSSQDCIDQSSCRADVLCQDKVARITDCLDNCSSAQPNVMSENDSNQIDEVVLVNMPDKVCSDESNHSQANALHKDEINQDSWNSGHFNGALSDKDCIDNKCNQTDILQEYIVTKGAVKLSYEQNSSCSTQDDYFKKPCQSDSVAALVYWYQTEAEVVLKILLTDVEEYNYELKPDHLHFSTLQGTKYFSNDLDLYGTIECKSSSITNNGQNIVIHLQKAVKGHWRRLLKTKNKKSWLYYNYDHIEVTETEEEVDFKMFHQRKTKTNKKAKEGKPPCAIKHYSSFEEGGSSSDSEDSDDSSGNSDNHFKL